MKEVGVVTALKGGYAVVRIGRNSACDACGRCGMTDTSKHVDFFVNNTLCAEVGDRVEVDISERGAARLALVAYAVPLVPALALLFLSLALKWADWLSVLLFFCGYAAGFAAVVLSEKLRRGKWNALPVQVRIISNNNGDPTAVTVGKGD